MEHKSVAWREFISLSKKLAKKLSKKIGNPDDYNVVGLSRGGLIPAVIVSHALNIRKVHCLGLQSYTDQAKNEIQLYQVPTFSDMNKIIIVDDLADTGDSLNTVSAMLKDKEYVTATVYKKSQSKFNPTVYGLEIPQEIWLDFPWEVK